MYYTDQSNASSINEQTSWVSKFPILDNPKVFIPNRPAHKKDQVKTHTENKGDMNIS